MRTRVIFPAAVAVVIVLAAAIDPAQAQNAGRWWEPTSPYNALYNPETVDTITGTVLQVDRFLPGRRAKVGIHVYLDTPDGPIDVHLGPAWFLEQEGLAVKDGMMMEVVGSRVSYDKHVCILAAHVRAEGRGFALRDENGYPRWARALSRR